MHALDSVVFLCNCSSVFPFFPETNKKSACGTDTLLGLTILHLSYVVSLWCLLPAVTRKLGVCVFRSCYNYILANTDARRFASMAVLAELEIHETTADAPHGLSRRFPTPSPSISLRSQPAAQLPLLLLAPAPQRTCRLVSRARKCTTARETTADIQE